MLLQPEAHKESDYDETMSSDIGMNARKPDESGRSILPASCRKRYLQLPQLHGSGHGGFSIWASVKVLKFQFRGPYPLNRQFRGRAVLYHYFTQPPNSIPLKPTKTVSAAVRKPPPSHSHSLHFTFTFTYPHTHFHFTSPSLPITFTSTPVFTSHHLHLHLRVHLHVHVRLPLGCIGCVVLELSLGSSQPAHRDATIWCRDRGTVEMRGDSYISSSKGALFATARVERRPRWQYIHAPAKRHLGYFGQFILIRSPPLPCYCFTL